MSMGAFSKAKINKNHRILLNVHRSWEWLFHRRSFWSLNLIIFIAFRLLRIPVLGRYGVLCKSVKHFNKSSLEIPVRQHVKTRNQITELSRGLPCCWRALRRTILGAVFVNITLHNLNPQWGSVLLRYWPYYRYLMHQYSQSKTNKPYKLFFTGTFRLAVLTSLAADHLSGPPGSPVPRLPHCIISQR